MALEDQLRNPFVVFCGKCNKILTDSFSLLDYKHSYLVHTFSSVKEEAESCYVDNAIFQNCITKNVKCTCGSHVGVYLSSANEEFNGMSGTYLFDKNSVKSYLLGNSVHKEKGLSEIIEDIEKLKSVVAKIYKKVYQ